MIPICMCGHSGDVHGTRRSHDGHVYVTACQAGAHLETQADRDADWVGGCECRKFIGVKETIPRTVPMIHNDAPKGDPPRDVSADAKRVLAEAAELIAGDRHESYGPADDEFDRIAAGWTIIFEDGEITSRHVALAMIWMKICRELASGKRDNWIDIAGYAGLGGAL